MYLSTPTASCLCGCDGVPGARQVAGLRGQRVEGRWTVAGEGDPAQGPPHSHGQGHAHHRQQCVLGGQAVRSGRRVLESNDPPFVKVA